jgi:hypothetical protein
MVLGREKYMQGVELLSSVISVAGHIAADITAITSDSLPEAFVIQQRTKGAI